jgi:hypothetical protein
MRGGAALTPSTYESAEPIAPIGPAIHAFELLAQDRVQLGERVTSPIPGTLIHPVHSRGQVFAWEIRSERA